MVSAKSPLKMRIAAGVLALVAWAGLGIQLDASTATAGAVLPALWTMLRYFTVLTNLGVAAALTGIAFGNRRLAAPRLFGGITIAILLVGVVHALLLRGLVELSGGAWLADLIMHVVVPVLTALFWLVFVAGAGLDWRDPFRWTAWPLAYFAYALVRGAVEGRYAYPFLDVAKHGWAGVAVNAAVIAVGFVIAGMAMVWLDRRLAGSA